MRAAKTALRAHFRLGQFRDERRNGREVVQQFVVEQNGEAKTVSAESAIRALATDGRRQGTAKSAISAAKTLLPACRCN